VVDFPCRLVSLSVVIVQIRRISALSSVLMNRGGYSIFTVNDKMTPIHDRLVSLFVNDLHTLSFV
jgi:hypothetical protein